jgi:hypothetical protein
MNTIEPVTVTVRSNCFDFQSFLCLLGGTRNVGYRQSKIASTRTAHE